MGASENTTFKKKVISWLEDIGWSIRSWAADVSETYVENQHYSNCGGGFGGV